MKKILAIILLSPISLFAQDSVKVTIQVQARDLDYVGWTTRDNFFFEELNDSIKVRFRGIPNPPADNTTVSITGYTMDWILLVSYLKTDYIAILANHQSRIENLLRAVGQTYLTSKLDEMDATMIGVDQSRKTFGRNRNRRKPQQ